MQIKRGAAIIIGAVAVWMFSGCGQQPDAQGWRASQKEAFSAILREDRYLSVCDAKPLAEEVLRTKDSELMSRMLVRYAENLANGCIDIEAFKRKQRARKSDDFKTDYEIYTQRVDRGLILQQLRNGKSVASILAPFVPKYREFSRLLNAYRTQKAAGLSPAKLAKIRLNIERVKLMKPLKGDVYALINIPEFKVRIIENNVTKVAMRVVVGKRHMQTPIFSQTLQYIVLNPPWNVPPSIMRKEMLPKLLRNPNYLKAKGMEAHRTYDLNSPLVDLSQYDLREYMIEKNATAYEKAHPKPMPFRFVQLPSKRNGLGRVKFLFPNKHSVYMHDTQSKYLFKRKYRAFSHGCVRLAKPNVMLKYLIEHYTNTPWSEAKKMYDSMQTHYIRVTRPLPVHTAYLTAYVDDDGTVKFFDDIYGYDRIQTLRR